jgi:hypothetical protein
MSANLSGRRRGAGGAVAALTSALLLAVAAPALAEAPTVPLMLGAGETEARIRLGQPDIARREARGAVWTYTRPGCALFVYLRADEAGDFRVVGAAAGPRRRGEAAPATDACLAAVAADKR